MPVRRRASLTAPCHHHFVGRPERRNPPHLHASFGTTQRPVAGEAPPRQMTRTRFRAAPHLTATRAHTCLARTADAALARRARTCLVASAVTPDVLLLRFTWNITPFRCGP